jgi:hypothetical protein
MAATKKNYFDIISKYVKKFPNSPKKTLARKIYTENKLVFGSISSAYGALRYYTGAAGAANRKELAKDKKLNLLSYGVDCKPINPFDLPESDYVPTEHFVIPTSISKLGIISDVHIPEHDIGALTVAIRDLQNENIDGLLLNGDILDMHQVSRHFKDPGKARIKKEFELGSQFLEAIRKAFPNIPIYFKEGNHEKRWPVWLRARAIEIWDDEEYTIPAKLRLGEKQIMWIPNIQPIKYGSLWIIHGNEISGNSRVSPAHAVSLKSHESTLTGDKHRPDKKHVKHQLSGNITTYYTLGCLCGLRADYLPNNDWMHGFAIAYVNSQGNISVQNKEIHNGLII